MHGNACAYTAVLASVWHAAVSRAGTDAVVHVTFSVPYADVGSCDILCSMHVALQCTARGLQIPPCVPDPSCRDRRSGAVGMGGASHGGACGALYWWHAVRLSTWAVCTVVPLVCAIRQQQVTRVV